MGWGYLFLAVGAAAAGFAVYEYISEKLSNLIPEKPKDIKRRKEFFMDVKNPEIREQCSHCLKMVPNLVLQPCGHKLLCSDCNFFQLTKEHCMKVCTKSSRCYIYYQKDEEIKQTFIDPTLSRTDLVSKNNTSYITDQFSLTEQECIICESLKLMVKFNCGHEVLCKDCFDEYKDGGGNKCTKCKKPLDKEPIVKSCGGDVITDWFNTEENPTFRRAIPVIQHYYGVTFDDVIYV